MNSARSLVLWRHGEAEAATGRRDRERRLTALGREQAARAAAQIASLASRPTLMLYSSAPRAAETAAIGAAALALPPAAMLPLEDLYMASAGTLLEAVSRHAAGAPSVLVVGHNPGLSELGCMLDPARAQATLETAGWWQCALRDPPP